MTIPTITDSQYRELVSELTEGIETGLSPVSIIDVLVIEVLGADVVEA